MYLRNRLLALLLSGVCAASWADSIADGARPTAAQINLAVEAMRHDPNLGEKKTIRTWHWKEAKEKKPPPKASNEAWLLDFFKYISQFAMALIWGFGALGVGICMVWITRVIKSRGPSADKARQTLPSHIQDLDVRPASLPEDIAAAARALLDSGRIREALSLLYRGALSRVIHQHAVVIAESFTEGEVLAAVRSRLNEGSAQYFARLLGLWQREVYAADHPRPEPIAALCAEFSPALESSR